MCRGIAGLIAQMGCPILSHMLLFHDEYIFILVMPDTNHSALFM